MDEGTCEGCGGPLTRMKWNTITDVLTCENSECDMYARPVMPNDTTKKREAKPKTKLPEWLGGIYGKEGNYTARLQKMRESLYTEEEDTKIL